VNEQDPVQKGDSEFYNYGISTRTSYTPWEYSYDYDSGVSINLSCIFITFTEAWIYSLILSPILNSIEEVKTTSGPFERLRKKCGKKRSWGIRGGAGRVKRDTGVTSQATL
jgi:hypothetical protein